MRVVRIISGLVVGSVGALLLGGGYYAALIASGMPPSAHGVIDILGTILLLSGFVAGCWLVFHYWKVDPKSPKPSVPPDQWGKP